MTLAARRLRAGRSRRICDGRRLAEYVDDMNLKVASALTMLAASTALGGDGGMREFRGSFVSGGRKIGVEGFEPQGAEKSPAIIVLHGAGGIGYGNGHIRELASAFAANGFATYLVHYFDRTGHSWVSDDAIRAHFEAWVATISDAVSFVRQRPGIDPGRIATFGFSLGGYLAVAHAASDPRVRAVIELAGGIDPSHAARARRFPPMLILHGEEDRRVRVERARELESLLKKLETPHQVQLYPREGHVFSPLAALDALARGLAFLKEFLVGAEDVAQP
jgi:dienelactone hydrolase